MATQFSNVSNWQGALVALGLGSPAARAFVAGAACTGVAYLAGMPSDCFREDGTIKPFKPLSAELDATYAHFLVVPLTAATAAYLFT